MEDNSGDLARERDYLRRELNGVGARLHRTVEQLAAARREAARQETVATLVRGAFLASRGDRTLDEIGVEILKEVTTRLGADRAVVLARDGDAGFSVLFALHDVAAAAPPPAPWPPFRYAAVPGDPFERWLAALLGLPVLLWKHDERSGLALLIGRRMELPADPFGDDHALLMGSLLQVIDVIREGKQKEAYIAGINARLEAKVAERTAELTVANEALRAATRLKDQFVSLVSHDLRSPLSGLKTMLSLLGKEAAGALNSDWGALLRNGEGSIDGMLNLINELLDLGRLQTGVVVPAREWCDTALLCEEVAAQVRFAAGRKGIGIAVEMPEGHRTFGDRALAGRVVANLLSNAVKFLRAGDTVTVFVPGDRPDTIAVGDTGPGVLPNMREGLFRHEVRTTTLGTAGEQGIGLGLPYCRDIMRAHGGDLTLEPSARGALFYATFPPGPGNEGEAG